MMKHIIVLIVCLLAIGNINAQTKKQYLKAAEKNLMSKDYKSAMVNYQIASEFDPGDADILFNIAEAARKFHAYTKAEQYYALLQLSDKKNDPKYKDALFHLAEVQTIQGKYSEAQDNFNLFLSNKYTQALLIFSLLLSSNTIPLSVTPINGSLDLKK